MPSRRTAEKAAREDQTPSEQIKVLIADSQLMFAQGLAAALEWASDVEIYGSYPETGPQTLVAIEEWKPDVALIDYWMTDMEGPALARTIARRLPECRIILLSWLYHRPHIAFALEAGAAGFIPKSLTTDHVLAAVRRVHGGEFPVLPDELEKQMATAEKESSEKGQILDRMAALTPRELEILIVLSYGGSVTEAAKQLGLSPKTLKKHISNILAKSGARSHTQAVAMARFCGLIQT